MLERRRNRFELGRRADVLCEHHRVRKGIRPATKGGPLIRAFISRASVNPDDCRIQGNLLIDRDSRQPPPVRLPRRIRMIFFCRLPVKRLKPGGRSPRFRSIILSGEGDGEANERVKRSRRASEGTGERRRGLGVSRRRCDEEESRVKDEELERLLGKG